MKALMIQYLQKHAQPETPLLPIVPARRHAMWRASSIAVATCVAAVACSLSAAANDYPIYPSGNYVQLSPGDFLHSSPGDGPIGDNFAQHPGWNFQFGFPMPASFVGVFSHPMNRGGPVYLWETSMGSGQPWEPPMSFSGPLLAVGYWDGTSFTQRGNEVATGYYSTGFPSSVPGLTVFCSITPMSAFNIQGIPGLLNAVRISANFPGHNQVTAVATGIPEPSSLSILIAGILGLLVCRRQRNEAQGTLTGGTSAPSRY